MSGGDKMEQTEIISESMVEYSCNECGKTILDMKVRAQECCPVCGVLMSCEEEFV